MNSLGDYDRWKTDPDLERREEICKHCGGLQGECDAWTCGRCGTRTCSESLVCDQCDEWECPPCNERENEREREPDNV
jgi:hypothetical protein